MLYSSTETAGREVGGICQRCNISTETELNSQRCLFSSVWIVSLTVSYVLAIWFVRRRLYIIRLTGGVDFCSFSFLHGW